MGHTVAHFIKLWVATALLIGAGALIGRLVGLLDGTAICPSVRLSALVVLAYPIPRLR